MRSQSTEDTGTFCMT